jgi:hypothetical protein
MNMFKRYLFILAVISSGFVFNKATGQTTTHHQLLQFSGIVVDKNSLKPIPYTVVMVKNSSHGTICDNNGYFSFVAQPSDTIEFASIGYKINTYRVPDTLTDRYALIHLMDKDTTQLKDVTIYPWPSREAFKQAFLSLNLPNNDLDRAKKNLAYAEAKARMEGTPMDAQANFLNTMQSEYNKLYYAGQLPPNNLLNPIAWAQFIQAWKNGSLNIQ